MGFWGFEHDSDKTCFEHLDKHVPDSIREEAEQELISRGYSREYVEKYAYEKSRQY